jgi:hypothetical protein
MWYFQSIGFFEVFGPAFVRKRGDAVDKIDAQVVKSCFQRILNTTYNLPG